MHCPPAPPPPRPHTPLPAQVRAATGHVKFNLTTDIPAVNQAPNLTGSMPLVDEQSLSGVDEGLTSGTPIALLIHNEDQRSRDHRNHEILDAGELQRSAHLRSHRRLRQRDPHRVRHAGRAQGQLPRRRRGRRAGRPHRVGAAPGSGARSCGGAGAASRGRGRSAARRHGSLSFEYCRAFLPNCASHTPKAGGSLVVA